MNLRWKQGSGRGGQQGMVSAEMAFAALGIAVAIVLVVGLFSLCLTQIQCGEAAAQIARLEARNDHAGALQISQGLDGADVQIEVGTKDVKVRVVIKAHPWGTWLPEIVIQATATAAREQR